MLPANTYICRTAWAAALLLCSMLLTAGEAMAAALTLNVPGNHSTIQAAIEAARNDPTNTYTIMVEPNVYAGGIAITAHPNSLTIQGRETARTEVAGGATNELLTISGNTAGSIVIQNLLFRAAANGVSVTNNTSTVIIKNCIFAGDTVFNGISVRTSPAAEITNNTFYLNGSAVTRDSDAVKVRNNLFSNNVIDINQVIISQAGITYNLFNPDPEPGDAVGTNWQPDTITYSNTDLRFVATTVRDFHLQSGVTGTSPVIDTGDTAVGTDAVDGTAADIGAYGGPFADTIPFRVSGLTTSSTNTTPYEISIGWSPNTAYTVAGYKVYYGYAPGTYDGSDALVSGVTATSPVDAGGTASLVLSGLTLTTAVPAAPSLGVPAPRNGALVVSWSAVPGATGYRVHYGIASTAENAVDAGNTTAYTIQGLTNGVVYRVSVSALSQAAYYLTVTAYDRSTQAKVAGVSHESAYANELTVLVGPTNESGLSNEVTGIPETLVPYPNLPNTGCFIATAAYGSPNDPAVRELRQFRDGMLLTTAPGRAFVRWYYAHSPAAARWLDAHGSLKPLVRMALAPAVAAAFLANKAPGLTPALVVISTLSLAAFLGRRVVRTRRPHQGDRRIAMRTLLLLVTVLLTIPAAAAAGPPVEQPHWSLEFKGGRFTPALENWETFYGRDNTWHYAGSLAYKLIRQLEAGVEAGYIKDIGQGYAPVNNVITGRVVYQAAPLNVFVLFRAVFSEQQWFVPYAGGGWTRMYYREQIEGQGTVRGSADGYHGRAGLQFVLDNVDRTASRNMRSDYGILHTSFFVEAQQTEVSTDTPSVDIGGTSYLLGLLFEF